MDTAQNNEWGLVQTGTGKVIKREDAVVLEAQRWVCEDEGHLGFFEGAGRCRICREPLVSKVVAVGFEEKT
jgi:hypothetical protein